MDSCKCSNCGGAADTIAADVIRSYEKDQSNLIPMLHALQDRFGYLAAETMEEVASWLSVPVSEVYGTATFYTLFTTVPLGKHIVRICDSTPCHIEGSKPIMRAIEKHLGICAGETTADGNFTFEVVSCFGLCGVAPAIMVNEDVYGNLTPDMIPGILDKYGKEAS